MSRPAFTFDTPIGVGWSTAGLKVTGISEIGGGVFWQIDFGVEEGGTPPDTFAGVLTGVDSGATANFTAVPQDTTTYIINYAAQPGCNCNLTGLYDVSGSADPLAPVKGYGWSSTAAVLVGIGTGYDAGFACVSAADAPTIPAFINGEAVTVTVP